VQSFYSKNEKPNEQAQSHTHFNTFWSNERNSFDGVIINHEKYINRNVAKIAQRISGNNINREFNGRENLIHKISREKLSKLDRTG
jgi:hypothetical protein